ncbi:unnamed protein product [Laminaria digitata]
MLNFSSSNVLRLHRPFLAYVINTRSSWLVGGVYGTVCCGTVRCSSRISTYVSYIPGNSTVQRTDNRETASLQAANSSTPGGNIGRQVYTRRQHCNLSFYLLL